MDLPSSLGGLNLEFKCHTHRHVIGLSISKRLVFELEGSTFETEMHKRSSGRGSRVTGECEELIVVVVINK